MGALYIKDEETAALVRRVAARSGMTNTDLVRELTAAREAELERETKAEEWLRWMAAHRKKNPLPPATGKKADKAFFDEMWGEV